jgi:hypothetical protein
LKRLSKVQIENIAKRIIEKYKELPENQGVDVYRIEPELLLTKLFGINIEHANLSLDGSILGLTAFEDYELEVYDDCDEVYYLCLDGKTVVIDKTLKYNVKQKGRYNFTLMHEGSHQILKMLYPSYYGANAPNEELQFYEPGSELNKPIVDWEEWQANALASALLLPEEIVRYGMFLFGLSEKVYILNPMTNYNEFRSFEALAEFLGVSKKALAIRMKQLGLLEKEYLDRPNKIIEI